MNKKIIAIAIASAMAAPAVMADAKISGMVGGHLTMDSAETGMGNVPADSSRNFWDNGITRFQIDGTSGNGFARIAADNRGVMIGTFATGRDVYVGYNISGNSSISMGRIAGAAKNLEKDPYIATFLQTRGTAAEASTAGNYGSSGFINNVIQYATKAGGMAVKFQFDPTDNSAGGMDFNAGHIGLSAAGKAGAINYWVAYNNGIGSQGGTSANHVNAKVGASMKMGTIKLTLNVSNADFDGAGFAASTSTALTADFNLGSGLSANVGYAANGDTGTWMRVAVAKQLNKGTKAYAGMTMTSDAADVDTGSRIGAGMMVKF